MSNNKREKYFVFDMDETLAELYSVYYFIASLRDNIDMRDISLTEAYTIFVRKILKLEQQSRPLGILRPGVLHIMQKLNRLKQRGRVAGVVIYSNNGHLESLEFIRDLIHMHINTNDLIKDCIHWGHPLRGEERQSEQGAANKTWSVLKDVLIQGPAQAPKTLQAEDVFFFDDLSHTDLQAHLIDNYIRVTPYKFRASVDVIAHVYKQALTEANVDTESLLAYIVEQFTNIEQPINMSDPISKIITIFKQKTRGTAAAMNRPPPSIHDMGYIQILSTISNLNSHSINGGQSTNRHITRIRTNRSQRPHRETRAKKKLKWRP
jgi:hypothetical protein